MNCPQCNTKVPDGSAYCLNCGASLILSGRSMLDRLWTDRQWGTRWILIGAAAAVVALVITVPLFALGVLTGGGDPSRGSLVSETPQPLPSPSPTAAVEPITRSTSTPVPAPTEAEPPSTGPVNVEFDLPDGFQVAKGGTMECEVLREDLLSRIYSAFLYDPVEAGERPPDVDRPDLDEAQEEELLKHLWLNRTFQGAPHLTAEEANIVAEELAGEPLTEFVYQGVWLIENTNTDLAFQARPEEQFGQIRWGDGAPHEESLSSSTIFPELTFEKSGGASLVQWDTTSMSKIETARIVYDPAFSKSGSVDPVLAGRELQEDVTVIDHMVADGVHTFSFGYQVSGPEDALSFGGGWEYVASERVRAYLYDSSEQLIAVTRVIPLGDVFIEVQRVGETEFNEAGEAFFGLQMEWPAVQQAVTFGRGVDLRRAICTPDLTDPEGYRLDIVSHTRVIASVELTE